MMTFIYSIPLSFYVISTVVNFLTIAFLGIFVYTRNKDANVNKIFAIYSLTAAQWTFFYFLWLSTKEKQLAEIYLRTCMIGVALMPAAFTHFILYLVKAKINPKIIFLNYLCSVFVVGIIYTPLFAYDFEPFLVFPVWGIAGILFPFHLAHFFANILYSDYIMFRAIRESDSIIFKKQIGYVLIATTIGYFGGLSNYLCWYHIPFPPVLNILVSVYVCVVTYAIIRYRLLDINVMLTRAGIFITVCILVLIPLYLGALGRVVLTKALGVNWWLLPSIISSILAAAGQFTYLYFKRRADNVLFKNDHLKYARITADAQHIPFVKDLGKLCSSIVNMPTEILDAAFTSLYLFDKDKKIYSFCATKYGKERAIKIELGNSMIKYLISLKKPIVLEELKREYDRKHDVFMKETLNTINKLNADVIVPFLIEEDLTGYLALGFKKTGEIYSTDDLNVLADLANQAALAIENAQFLKEREEMQGKLREAETLSTIKDLLGSVNHELYNLLAPISGMLQSISMGDYDNKLDRLKPDAQKNAERALFTKTYLGWVRDYVNSDDKILAYQLTGLVDGGISYSRDNLEKQGIKTQVNINHKIFVIGYESLPLLFRNLILHSVYGYGMEKGGIITISARILEDGATVEITQLDTGEDLTRYLEEGSTMGGKRFAEKGKLGGVNYYIARAVVSKHKGVFKVEPTGGKGTKFVIQLPLDFNKVS